MWRCRSRGSSSTDLLFKKSRDIIVERVHHEKHQQKHAHLLSHFSVLHSNGTADDHLHQEEKKVPSIQHGYRQKIENPEIDAQYGQETEKTTEPFLGLLPRHLRTQDRPAEVARPNQSVKHYIQGQARNLRIVV